MSIKPILDAQSEFFAALFRSHMKDKNEMKLSEDPLPTFESFNSFLKFLYCGKIDLNPTIAVQLLSCCKFFRLGSDVLENACFRMMISHVSAENFIEFVNASWKSASPKLFNQLVVRGIRKVTPSCLSLVEEFSSPQILKAMIGALASEPTNDVWNSNNSDSKKMKTTKIYKSNTRNQNRHRVNLYEEYILAVQNKMIII
eukprot:TRINITY_DN5721_c0_g1_i1.p1 TRINITY_DN5721_c0_g1~~TRINITY_DN5721_c0_g1_i1.p1  ORF type:complete len:200 (+),score=21.29 TRINITY_DN5721_c0_g1_i1:57-656(+)